MCSFKYAKITSLRSIANLNIIIKNIIYNINYTCKLPEMKNIFISFCFIAAIRAFTLTSEDCQNVGDNCPVWNGWSPKCHVS